MVVQAGQAAGQSLWLSIRGFQLDPVSAGHGKAPRAAASAEGLHQSISSLMVHSGLVHARGLRLDAEQVLGSIIEQIDKFMRNY